MPTTFTVAQHPAEPFTATHAKLSRDQYTVLSGTTTTHVPSTILQSSMDGSQNVITQRNGFVQGALLAYNKHHNLIIRPDDVWIAILSQLNFYINAHADELRDKFVSCDDKKELIVTSESTTMEGMDFGELSIHMSEAISANVKDESLVPWVMPDFTTTTPDDSVICSVLLMSTLKEYFSYQMRTRCGIPAITLEGTRDDWQSILDRTDRLHEFGAEPKEWGGMLRAILSRFVHAFDTDASEAADKAFWERMVHEEHASGTYWIGGWMSVFCAWDSKGVFFADRNEDDRESLSLKPRPVWARSLELDGHRIPRVRACPDGYAEVDVKVVDVVKQQTWDCRMLAGHVGISLEGDQLDTIRMAPQWFMYVKGEAVQVRH
ncbi:hypothetical protein DXG01_014910 [Tephrocybe rancida]|nr:hypothetical protein DXG01_014910 [Tephrocybe rancida]